jgi:hypothetical protein
VARREAEPPALEVGTPPVPDSAAPASGAVPTLPALSAGSGPLSVSGTGSLSTTAGLPDASSNFGAGGASTAEAAPAPTGPAASTPASSSRAAPAAPLPAAHKGPDPARRLRTGYGLVLLAAFAGVAAVTAQFKIRLA